MEQHLLSKFQRFKMSRKSFLKITLLLLLPFFTKAQSQQRKLDSLHTALKMVTDDTVKMLIVQNLGLHYLESNRDSALFFTEQFLDLTKKIKQPLWTASGLSRKAYILQKSGNLPLSFKLLNESKAIL